MKFGVGRDYPGLKLHGSVGYVVSADRGAGWTYEGSATTKYGGVQGEGRIYDGSSEHRWVSGLYSPQQQAPDDAYNWSVPIDLGPVNITIYGNAKTDVNVLQNGGEAMHNFLTELFYEWTHPQATINK